MQAQQEKDKAMKAAMEQAAADYAAETAKLKPSQPLDPAPGNEGGSKKKKKKAKQKKAQQAEAEAAAAGAQKVYGVSSL